MGTRAIDTWRHWSSKPAAGRPRNRPPACPFRPTGSRCEPQPVRAGPASGVNGLGLTQLGFDPAGPVQRHRGMVAGHSGIGAACVRADCWCPGSGGATGSGVAPSGRWAAGPGDGNLPGSSPLRAWSPWEQQGRRVGVPDTTAGPAISTRAPWRTWAGPDRLPVWGAVGVDPLEGRCVNCAGARCPVRSGACAWRSHRVSGRHVLRVRRATPGQPVEGDDAPDPHGWRRITVAIVDGGGDYLLPVKENQPTLQQDLADAFSPSGDRNGPRGTESGGLAGTGMARARGHTDGVGG